MDKCKNCGHNKQDHEPSKLFGYICLYGECKCDSYEDDTS